MNTAAALNIMTSSKTIEEWNLNREIVKRAFKIKTSPGSLMTANGVVLKCKGVLVSDTKELLNSPLPVIDKMCGKILKHYVKKTA